MKTNENLTLIQEYWDEAKTKLRYQYYVDKNNQMQGEYKFWFGDGQIGRISNRKDGGCHGKYQMWSDDGRRFFIETRHFKKRQHGTKIKFKYGK